jgi:hypothetical protein
MAGKAKVKINGGMPKKGVYTKGAIKRPAAAGPLANLSKQANFAQMLKGMSKK